MDKNFLNNLVQSEIRNMSLECDKVGGINLSQGICDLPLENILKENVLNALNLGINQYTRYDGIDELRTAIAKKALYFNKISSDPHRNITVSCGATGALYCVCLALFSPGDEVLLFQPYYGYHEYTLQATGLKPVFVNLSPPDWSFDINELEKAVTSKTKAIIINTPSNPCGKVFSYDEIAKLGEFCIKHNLTILTDEIYEYITYDDKPHTSPASVDFLKDNVVTISGYSKTFSITGWRIGYSIAGEDKAKLIGLVNDLVYVCAPAPLQYSVAQAIDVLDDDFYNKLKKEFYIKREIICDTLEKCGLSPYIPEGAYYVLADISKLPGTNSKDKCMFLLEKTRIASVPGSAFYKDDSGDNLARFCFAKDDEILNDACNNLKKYFL